VVGYRDCDVDRVEDSKMAGVRRVTRSILRYAYPLYVVAIILQVYFAGEGIFGAGDSSIEDANSLDLHRGFGFFIAQPFAVLLLIVTLLAWLPNKRIRWLSILAPILLVVQSILPETGRWAGGLHPLNAFVLLGLMGYLTWTFRSGEALAGEATPAAGAV
jgi:Family of unknown function (DUF6220)